METATAPESKEMVTIQVSRESLKEWDKFKNHEGESYEDMVNGILRYMAEEDEEILSGEGLKEIEESERDYKAGRFKTAEQMNAEYGS